MADRRDYLVAVYGLAVGVCLHYGWTWFAPEIQALVWNAAGAAAMVALLVGVTWRAGWPARGVAAWWIAEECLVAGCSIGFIFWPWVIEPGQPMCQPLIGVDLGKIGIALVAGLLAVNLQALTGGKRGPE
jgi:hypothetical protein